MSVPFSMDLPCAVAKAALSGARQFGDVWIDLEEAMAWTSS